MVSAQPRTATPRRAVVAWWWHGGASLGEPEACKGFAPAGRPHEPSRPAMFVCLPPAHTHACMGRAGSKGRSTRASSHSERRGRVARHACMHACWPAGGGAVRRVCMAWPACRYMCRDDLARKSAAAALLHHGSGEEECAAIGAAFSRESARVRMHAHMGRARSAGGS